MQPLTVQHLVTTRPDTVLASGLHVAIISDGNGRWATTRGLASLRRAPRRRRIRPPDHRSGAASRHSYAYAVRAILRQLEASRRGSQRDPSPSARIPADGNFALHRRRRAAEHHRAPRPHSRPRCARPSPIPKLPPRAARGFICGWRSITPRAKRSITPPAASIRSPNYRRSPSRTSWRKFFAVALPKWTCSSGLAASSGSPIFSCGNAPSPNLFFCRNAGRILPSPISNARCRNSAGASEHAEPCPTRLRDNFVRRELKK